MVLMKSVHMDYIPYWLTMTHKSGHRHSSVSFWLHSLSLISDRQISYPHLPISFLRVMIEYRKLLLQLILDSQRKIDPLPLPAFRIASVLLHFFLSSGDSC